MAFADLVVVCILLQLVSLVAGWAPLFVLAPSKRRWISTLGVGVLMGTAFVVVIPTGLHDLYKPVRGPPLEAHREVHPHLHAPGDATASVPAGSDAAGSSSQQSWEDNLANVVSPLLPRKDTADDWQGSLNKFKKTDQQASGPGAGGSKGNGPAAGASSSSFHGAHSHGRRLLVSGDAHDHSSHSHDHAHGASSGSKGAVASSPVPQPLPRSSYSTDVAHEQSEHEVASMAAAAQLVACFDDSHASKHMGALMALGFVAMLLVDRLVGRSVSADHVPGPVSSADVENAMQPQPQQSASNKTGAGVELMSRTKSSSVASPNLAMAGGGEGSLTGGTPRPGPKNAAHSTPTTGGSTSHLSFPSHTHGHSHASPVLSSSSSGSLSASASSQVLRRGLAYDANLLLGVFVYALVDGATLGAQALGSRGGGLGWTILPALVLHRAPLVFGAACFLMYKGRPAAAVRRLVLFLAPVTPLISLLTYMGLAGGGSGSGDYDALGSEGSWSYAGLGLATLFAGGAFLFTIAVHILPEIQAQNGGGHSHAPHHAVDTGAEVAHGHGGPGPSGSGGASSAAASASPRLSSSPNPRSHDDLSSIGGAGGASGGEGGPGADERMSWRLVWVLNLGLILPLIASWILPREDIF